MRKKAIVLLLVAVSTSALLSACSSGSNSSQSNNSVKITEMDNGTMYRLSELPYTIKYGESDIEFSDVFFCEGYSDYEYSFFTFVDVDLSALSDSDLHWFDKEEPISCIAWLNGSENNYDSYPLLEMTSYSKDNHVYYVFGCEEKHKYTSGSADITIQLCVSLDSTSAPEDTYMYSCSVPATVDTSSTSPHNELISEYVDQLTQNEETYNRIMKELGLSD